MSLKTVKYATVKGVECKLAFTYNVKGGERKKLKIPGVNWTPSKPAREKRIAKNYEKLAASKDKPLPKLTKKDTIHGRRVKTLLKRASVK